MKTLIAALNNPLVVLLHSVLGAAFLCYLEDAAYQAVLWYLPCLFVIAADIFAGIPAARYRGEKITFSTFGRRTVNKMVCYFCWVLMCVCLSQNYDSTRPLKLGMAVIFLLEGASTIGNWLEPKGYIFSMKGLLKLIGRRHNAEGLEDIVEKKDE